MADQLQIQQLRQVLDAELRHKEGLAGYQRLQRRVRRRAAADRADAVRVNATGFPIAQGKPGFARRLAGLLNPL
jgi:hypothetical protein